MFISYGTKIVVDGEFGSYLPKLKIRSCKLQTPINSVCTGAIDLLKMF